jgi:hypothetical protein
MCDARPECCATTHVQRCWMSALPATPVHTSHTTASGLQDVSIAPGCGCERTASPASWSLQQHQAEMCAEALSITDVARGRRAPRTRMPPMWVANAAELALTAASMSARVRAPPLRARRVDIGGLPGAKYARPATAALPAYSPSS